MNSYCPTCGSFLFALQEDCIRLECAICPYTHKFASIVTVRTNCKLKDVDDILTDGEDARRNVQTTAKLCPICGYFRAFFVQLQVRCADESMTTYYRCCNQKCRHVWKE